MFVELTYVCVPPTYKSPKKYAVPPTFKFPPTYALLPTPNPPATVNAPELVDVEFVVVLIAIAGTVNAPVPGLNVYP